ncbi:MAG: 5-formyltetrahydrofolate cyclo-ligase, partial [Granulosicoccus sp.]|nr:5-formyltetrahydrofolate cyclo-ligase [Granulosicoccus sp.]
ERGARVTLPVVEAKERPLTFREWTPDATLVPGVWNIPVPVDGEVLEPTVVISPLVGFDRALYRLGYGGGFFDRTLQELFRRDMRPRVIGVGHSRTAIPTIYPQPHDIPMTDVITERGVWESNKPR